MSPATPPDESSLAMKRNCQGANATQVLSRTLLLFMATTVGCGGASSDLARVPCSGVVIHAGKPLAGAEVLFVPVDASTKTARSARAVTGADGSYMLGTEVNGDGVIPGKYQVAITARGPGKKIAPELNPGLPPEEAELPGPPLIPEKYFRPETSGLTADVPPAGSKDQNFTLP